MGTETESHLLDGDSLLENYADLALDFQNSLPTERNEDCNFEQFATGSNEQHSKDA